MIIAQREAAAIPSSSSVDLFEASGVVLVTGMVGVFTESSDPTSCQATVSAAGVNLFSSVELGATPAGRIVSTTGGGSSALQPPFFLADGEVIAITTLGSTGGSVRWSVLYEQVDGGSAVNPL